MSVAKLSQRIFFVLFTIGLTFFPVLGCHNPLYDEPPLHDAAKRGNLKKVQKLVKQGISVNSRNNEGATPLHWAAFKGHADVVKYLLSRGAKVNALTTRGSTPLKLAEDYKRKDVIKILKSRGGKS